MNKTIALENNLSPFKTFLESQGCQVIDVKSARNTRVDAIVLAGSDENLMNMQDIVIDAPVITARGRTPQEVWNEIQKH